MKTFPGPLMRAGGTDRTYIFIRDNPHPRPQAVRGLVEELWAKYWPYADDDFYRDIPLYFAPRFWEMDLACELMAKGLVVEERKGHGPDIPLVVEGRRVWVEAIAATDRTGDDRSQELPYTRVSRAEPRPHLPAIDFAGEGGIILRLRNAIEEKSRKYKKYLADGIVKAGEPYVIAVNGSQIDAAIVEDDVPWIVRSVYPIGETKWDLYLETETFTERHEHRPAVVKAKGASVATDIFLTDEYAGISGVVYSRINAQNRDRGYVHVHNLRATNGLNRGWLKLGTEYWPDCLKGGVTLKITDWDQGEA